MPSDLPWCYIKIEKIKTWKKTPIIVIPRLYITKQAYLEINKNIFSGIISAFSNKFFKSFEIAINSTPVADFEYEPYLSADGGKVLEQNIKWLSEKGFEFFKNDTVTQYATARYFIYNPKWGFSEVINLWENLLILFRYITLFVL